MAVLRRSAPVRRAPSAGPVVAGLVVAGLGVAALLARPMLRSADDPTLVLVLLFIALGLAGARWPLPRPTPPTAAAPVHTVVPAAALAFGLAAFAAGRLAGGGTLGAPGPVLPFLLNGLAAVAEEAFFRRLLYGLLSAWGTNVAIIASAAAFAAVHVTVWGWAVLPLDLAAGLILSWQRAVTGSWEVPALTHVAANVLGAM